MSFIRQKQKNISIVFSVSFIHQKQKILVLFLLSDSHLSKTKNISIIFLSIIHLSKTKNISIIFFKYHSFITNRKYYYCLVSITVHQKQKILVLFLLNDSCLSKI